MAVGFPPDPVYPFGIDTDETLYLVYNTTEAPLAADNQPWADEVVIVPVAADQAEIWADNGFANLDGELFYYDSVAKDSNGKVYKLKRCARNLGGRPTKLNKAGAYCRGFVISEHHNQLVDAVLRIEGFVGENFTAEQESLDWRIRNLRATPVIFDDFTCPDINFTFNVIEDDPASGIVAQYLLEIAGTFTQFRLDFGDGTFTTSQLSGTHRYAPNSSIDPIVTLSNDKCQIIQSPIERSNPVEPPPPTDRQRLSIPAPEITAPPNLLAVSLTVPNVQVNFPNIQGPCLDIGPIGPIGPINIPSIITIVAPSFSPISLVAPTFAPISIIGPTFSPISVIVPSFAPISITGVSLNPISVVGPTYTPISITGPSFGPIVITGPTYTPITIEAPDFSLTPITIVAPAFSLSPIVILAPDFSLTPIYIIGPTLTPISIVVPDFSLTPIYIIGPSLTPISLVAPSLTPIYLVGPTLTPISIVGPSLTPISVSPVTVYVSVVAPSFSPISIVAPTLTPISISAPSLTPISLTWGTPPSIAPVQFGPAPTISVSWGTPPTVSCTVTVACPTATPMAAAAAMAEPGSWNPDQGITVDVGDIGIPSEIKIIAPQLPDIKVIHNLPVGIDLRVPNIPDVRLVVPEGAIPNEIRVVNAGIPESIAVIAQDIPKSIKLDAQDIPRMIPIVVPDDFPRTITLDAKGVPTSIQVVGVPSSIELIAPAAIPLKWPDEVPEIPLVYKGSPIELKITMDVQKLTGGDDPNGPPCVMIVPCTK